MKISEKYSLPFVTVCITYRGVELEIKNVLLDTGSATTIFRADLVSTIGIIPEKDDVVDTIRGVGGIEYVYAKTMDVIQFDECRLQSFVVEIGSMNYGMDIDGILGFDFMRASGMQIDTLRMQAMITK